MDFVILVLRMAMLFQPLKVFLPLAFFTGLAGVLKAGSDILAAALSTGQFDWTLIFQPAVLSTSADLLLLTGLQLLLIGMLADGVLRRIALHNAAQVPSHRVQLIESSSGLAAERELEAPATQRRD